MKANELMSREVFTCTKDDTLETAARSMWEYDTGCLVVADPENHAVGMITDRDIAMAAYTQGAPLRDIRVESAMAHEVKSCGPMSSLGEVEEVMRSARIRRMLVVDAGGKIVGLISLGDIARSSQSSPLHAAAIPGVARTLAAVTEPRGLPIAAE
ncbi:MAG TPA: CBS domain-containing protein [Polyangiaceae bacterium]|nr:CBS domain-containing protein [Polyangiaceae bacterium]